MISNKSILYPKSQARQITIPAKPLSRIITAKNVEISSLPPSDLLGNARSGIDETAKGDTIYLSG